MKKYYWMLISAMLLNVSGALAQEKRDAYVFPIKPGSEQWRQFETGQAMVDASQIPAETLRKMSTEGLVETCLSYPLLFDITAANNLQRGFEGVANDFNGLQELLKRPDAGQVLLRIYQKMDPNTVDEKGSNEKKGAFTFDFTYVEMLLAQPAILSRFTVADRKALVKECFAKFKAKDSHFDTFGGFGEATSALVIGRVLKGEAFSSIYQSGKSSLDMQVFLTSCQVQNTEVINQIIADAQSFTK